MHPISTFVPRQYPSQSTPATHKPQTPQQVMVSLSPLDYEPYSQSQLDDINLKTFASNHRYGAGNTSTQEASSSRSGRLKNVKPPRHIENACAICAIATATGLTFEQVYQSAIRQGFNHEGMDAVEIKNTLNDLNIRYKLHINRESSWEQVPDLAIGFVHGLSEAGHAVVFQKGNQGRIRVYDNKYNNDRPYVHYQLLNGVFFEIQ